MKKAEFIGMVSEKSGLSKKDSIVALDAVLNSISDVLASGDTINFIGFGAFSTNMRAARKAKIPGTETEVDVPETRVVKFKSGKTIKDSVAIKK